MASCNELKELRKDIEELRNDNDNMRKTIESLETRNEDLERTVFDLKKSFEEEVRLKQFFFHASDVKYKF